MGELVRTANMRASLEALKRWIDMNPRDGEIPTLNDAAEAIDEALKPYPRMPAREGKPAEDAVVAMGEHLTAAAACRVAARILLLNGICRSYVGTFLDTLNCEQQQHFWEIVHDQMVKGIPPVVQHAGCDVGDVVQGDQLV